MPHMEKAEEIALMINVKEGNGGSGVPGRFIMWMAEDGYTH